jgi:hypothetical protein
MSRNQKFSVMAALALAGGVAAIALLPANHASAGKTKSEECGMDAVSQSICVYRLILDDIDAKVTMRGGGGVTAIIQKSDDVFEARLAQEGHEDIRSYQLDLSDEAKPRIKAVTESTKSY